MHWLKLLKFKMATLAPSERSYLLRSLHPDSAKRRCLSDQTDYHVVFGLMLKVLKRNSELEEKYVANSNNLEHPSILDNLQEETNCTFPDIEGKIDVWLDICGPVFMEDCSIVGCSNTVSICKYYTVSMGGAVHKGVICERCHDAMEI